MSISDEFSFIKKIKPIDYRNKSLITGIGDDEALFRGNDGVEEIVCVDTMVEGIHFNELTMEPFHIGYKVLASNISDIAAMGGTPTFYLVSMAIPHSWNETKLLEIYRGMNEIATRYGAELIGGDTTSSKSDLVITITAMGRIEKNKHLLRSNSRDGDVVFVTGTLGDSGAGLKLLLDNGLHHHFTSYEDYLVKRHQMPTPQVEAGQILSNFKRVALNDISDGIASEANEIAEASGVTVTLDVELLPRSKALSRYPEEQQKQWMLNSGEDFELIGTIARDEWNIFKPLCVEKGIKATEIGTVAKGEPEVFIKEKGQISKLLKRGYNHFKRD